METIIGLVYSFSSLVMVVLSFPMIRGNVSRNKLYGFRTPSTLKNDEIWYPANKASGYCMLTAGLISGVGITAIMLTNYIGLSKIAINFWAPCLLILSVIIALIFSFVFLHRIKSKLPPAHLNK